MASVKMKILRYNNKLFLKFFGKISGDKIKSNKFNKKSSAEDWNSYKKQISFSLKLLSQTKEKYFNNLNVKKVSDKKPF